MATPIFSFPFDNDEALENLKAATALLSFYIEICPDLNIAREFEDKAASLAQKAKDKRQKLKQKQLDLMAETAV